MKLGTKLPVASTCDVPSTVSSASLL